MGSVSSVAKEIESWGEQDRPPIQVSISLLLLGMFLIIRSLLLSPELTYSLVVFTPNVQVAEKIEPKAKQVVSDVLRSEGIDPSHPAIADDLKDLFDAMIVVQNAWFNVSTRLEVVLRRLHPRGHKDQVLKAIARDFDISAITLRRRIAASASNSARSDRPSGLFEELRQEVLNRENASVDSEEL